MPSMVSSIGSMWTRFPYLTSWHWWTDTTSPSLTLRFDLTTLFILIFGSSHVSSASAMQIVSLLFLPCNHHQLEIKRSYSQIDSTKASNNIAQIKLSPLNYMHTPLKLLNIAITDTKLKNPIFDQASA